MKNFIPRIYILIFFLFSSFLALAQEPTEETPEDTVPINGQVLWLALAGIAFAVIYFRKRTIKAA